MARKAQSDWFFLQKCYTICVRRAKINWKVQKAWSSSQKNSFSQAYLSFSQFVLKSCSNQSGQNDFGLKSCNFSGQNHFGLKSCSNRSGQNDLGPHSAGEGPHFTENWVPILKKVCPQGVWPQCRYKRGSLLATAGSGWLIRDTIESNTINACTCTILNWEMCNIVNTRFLRHFGVITEITAKSPQKLYHGSFFGPFLRCDFSCP